MKKIQLLKKYLPDIFINIGSWILFYNIIRPTEKNGGLPKLPSLSGYADYHIDEKMFGVIILTIGITILIRRVLDK